MNKICKWSHIYVIEKTKKNLNIVYAKNKRTNQIDDSIKKTK